MGALIVFYTFPGASAGRRGSFPFGVRKNEAGRATVGTPRPPLRQVIQLSKDLIADSLSSRCWRVCEFDSIAGLRVIDDKVMNDITLRRFRAEALFLANLTS